MNLDLVYSRIREDEKLLLETLREPDNVMIKIDVRDLQFGLDRRSTVLDWIVGRAGEVAA